MDPNQLKNQNINDQQQASPKGSGTTDLKNRIDKIITTGVSQQDVRTSALLKGEIEKDSQQEFDNQVGIINNPIPSPLPPWLRRFNVWRRHYMSDFIFLLWLAVIVGLFAGFAAHIFNRMITIISDIFLSHIKPDRINW